MMMLHRLTLPLDSVMCSDLAATISKGKVVYRPGQTEKPATDDDEVPWQPRKDKIKYLTWFRNALPRSFVTNLLSMHTLVGFRCAAIGFVDFLQTFRLPVVRLC